eukprot:COSAG05_NODE_1027_length_6117_cov_7.351778_10_plen_47_part_00
MRVGGEERELASRSNWQVDGLGQPLVVTAEAEIRRAEVEWGPQSGA